MVVASQQQIYQLNHPAQLSQASTKTHTFPLRIKVLSQQLRSARDLVVPRPWMQCMGYSRVGVAYTRTFLKFTYTQRETAIFAARFKNLGTPFATAFLAYKALKGCRGTE